MAQQMSRRDSEKNRLQLTKHGRAQKDLLGLIVWQCLSGAIRGLEEVQIKRPQQESTPQAKKTSGSSRAKQSKTRLDAIGSSHQQNLPRSELVVAVH